MIVISGALVLVALVLLIFGITTREIDFVYASIVVSLVSFVFLLIGILQRRGDRTADTSASPGADQSASAPQERPGEGVTAIVPRRRVEEPQTAQFEVADEQPQTAQLEVADDELTSGTVLVVPGRPRYHVAGCRYLSGKSTTEVDVGDAREEGFSPCGVCKPDDALAATEEPVPAGAPAGRSRAITTPAQAPAKRTPRAARAPRAEPSPAAVAAAADPTAGAADDPVLAAVAGDAAPASPAAAASDGAGAAPAKSTRRSGNVVVIPDRGKFHRAECRYVRNAAGASTMSRTAATRKGYDACGVCKP